MQASIFLAKQAGVSEADIAEALGMVEGCLLKEPRFLLFDESWRGGGELQRALEGVSLYHGMGRRSNVFRVLSIEYGYFLWYLTGLQAST